MDDARDFREICGAALEKFRNGGEGVNKDKIIPLVVLDDLQACLGVHEYAIVHTNLVSGAGR